MHNLPHRKNCSGAAQRTSAYFRHLGLRIHRIELQAASLKMSEPWGSVSTMGFTLFVHSHSGIPKSMIFHLNIVQ